MIKPPIADLVYARLYPTPKSTDPPSWQNHVTRNIVQEVRAETTCFYGAIDCLEAQYPGLDYTNPAHRARLSRFTYHRRMFRVLDELRLTAAEIQALCQWEGTKSAREKYEKDHNRLIRDTTWDDVEVEAPRLASAVKTHLRGGEDIRLHLDGTHENGRISSMEEDELEDSDADDGIEEEESEDELQQSIGVDLNRHLLAATAARARGEEVVLDADWEQWLKEAAERGASEAASLAGIGPSQGSPLNVGSYEQQISPMFRANPRQHVEVMSAPQYAAYSATTSSAPPTGTAI